TVLEFSGVKSASCTIESLSSEEERLKKRIGKEFHTKRRSAYQLGRMINKLLENESYNIISIASYFNVTEKTIAKYISVSNVDPGIRKEAEQARVGLHALTDIQSLSLNSDTKDHIFKRYINKEV